MSKMLGNKNKFDYRGVLSKVTGMDRGLVFSLSLHAAVIVFALVGLPDFSNKQDILPPAIEVDFVNVEKERQVQKQIKEEAREEEEKPEVKQKNIAREEVREPVTAGAVPTLKPEPRPKAKPKPKPKPKLTRQQQIRHQIRPAMRPRPPKRFQSSKIAELIDRSIKKEETVQPKNKPVKKKAAPKKEKPAPKRPVIDGLAARLQAAAYRDAFVAKINSCWNRPKGLKDSDTMSVPVRVYYNSQGDLVRLPELLDKAYQDPSKPFRRAYGDSVIRAITTCGTVSEAIPLVQEGNRYFDITFRPPTQ